jgi:hypothetical protein
MKIGLSPRARERIQSAAHNAADHAKDAFDTGAHVAAEKAKAYSDLGIAQLSRVRDRLPVQFQRPSTPMVLTALGTGLLLGLLLGGKASHAIEDLGDERKSAMRRRRLNDLAH